jgi:hypothetical protein
MVLRRAAAIGAAGLTRTAEPLELVNERIEFGGTGELLSRARALSRCRAPAGTTWGAMRARTYAAASLRVRSEPRPRARGSGAACRVPPTHRPSAQLSPWCAPTSSVSSLPSYVGGAVPFGAFRIRSYALARFTPSRSGTWAAAADRKTLRYLRDGPARSIPRRRRSGCPQQAPKEPKGRRMCGESHDPYAPPLASDSRSFSAARTASARWRSALR